MANLKITVSLPEDLARKSVRAVPASKRSRYVAELIDAKLRQRDQILIEACERANSLFPQRLPLSFPLHVGLASIGNGSQADSCGR